jgi:hypothetical protein
MDTLTLEGEVGGLLADVTPRPAPDEFPTTIKGPVNSVYGKIAQLMSVVTKVAKDKVNDFHKYSYASNVAVLSAVREEMVRLKLIYVPTFSIVDGTSDKTSFVVEVVGKIIDAETGDYVEVTALGAGTDKGDKHVQKGQTAADKYLWLKFLMLPTPDDPEADTATDARTAPSVSTPESKGTSGAIGHVEGVKITDVQKKPGKGPWVITTDRGEFNSFDTDVVTQAQFAMQTGSTTGFKFKTTKWGRDIIKEAPKS